MKKRYIVGGLIAFAAFAAWLMKPNPEMTNVYAGRANRLMQTAVCTTYERIQTGYNTWTDRCVEWTPKLDANLYITFIDQEGPDTGQPFSVLLCGVDPIDEYGVKYHHGLDSLVVKNLDMAEVQ